MMRRMKIKTVSVALLIAIAIPSFGQADELPLFYEGVRPLGMGGAFTAVSDDENAMLYNPAGLNQIKGFHQFEILNPTMEVNKKAVDFGTDLADILRNANESERFDKIIDFIGQRFGENLHGKISFFPNLVFHNFGIGILAQGVGNGEVHNPLSSSAIELKVTLDAALLVSGARQFEIKKKHPLLVGFTAKGVSRQQIDKSYTVRQIAEQKFDIQTELNEEIGFALDLGALYPIPIPSRLNPTVGLSLQNIVGGDLGSAGELPSQVNLGVSLKPKIRYGKVLLAADIVDLTRNLGEDNDLAKRLHMGVEYKFPRILSFRTGLYQGYPSFGTTIDFWLVKFSAAYYIEEVGAFTGQKPDPRYIAQLSIGF